MPTSSLFADRAHRLFLNHAQQLDLHMQRQIRDFIQKKRAALGGLNQALLVADRARKTAAFVAKELALHEFGGNCAAIDRYERAIPARAGLMNEFRHQLLAGAGFAGNMHRRLAASDAGDHFAQLVHGGRCTKQAGTKYAGVAIIGIWTA